MFQNKSGFKIVSFVMILFLYGCEVSTERSELEEFINNTKKMAKQKIDELPEEKESIIYNYIGLNNRSPFQTSEDYIRGQMEHVDGANKPDIGRKKEILEGFDLNDLTMVGSLKSEDGTYWALIKDSNSMIYKVKPGNYIGRNFGKITNVSAEGIEIDELVSDSLGTWKTNNVLMKLVD